MKTISEEHLYLAAQVLLEFGEIENEKLRRVLESASKAVGMYVIENTDDREVLASEEKFGQCVAQFLTDRLLANMQEDGLIECYLDESYNEKIMITEFGKKRYKQNKNGC